MKYQIKDIGRLSGDVLLFGGPYSNKQATQALFQVAAHRNIGADNRICTGDIVAYCAGPVECWRMVTRGSHWIVGNCEKQIAAGADDCGCGFEDGTVCDLAARNWYPYAAAQMKDEPVLGPDMIVFEHAGLRYAVIHGGLGDISRFIWPTSPQSVFADEIAAIEHEVGQIDGVIAGHCGIAFQRHVAGRHWINAGVIGMPPHDGRPETRFAILGSDGARFERLSYAYDAAAQAMQSAGLNNGYDQALRTGLWPAEDVLPTQLRR